MNNLSAINSSDLQVVGDILISLRNPIDRVAERAISSSEEQRLKKRKVSYCVRPVSDLSSIASSNLTGFKIRKLMETHQRQSSEPISFCIKPIILENSQTSDTKKFDALIIKAIFSGNLEEFKELLQGRPDLQEHINATVWGDFSGLTCVHWAIEAQKIDILRFLVEEKNAEIDVEENLDDGWIPSIVRLLSKGHQENILEIAEYLVLKGNCLDGCFCVEDEWRTPVGYYAIMGDLKNLQTMVSLGADLNIPNSANDLPLFEVINILLDDPIALYKYEIFAEIVEYLIEKGAMLDSPFSVKECLNRIEEFLSSPDIPQEKMDALIRVKNGLNSLNNV